MIFLGVAALGFFGAVLRWPLAATAFFFDTFGWLFVDFIVFLDAGFIAFLAVGFLPHRLAADFGATRCAAFLLRTLFFFLVADLFTDIALGLQDS